MGSLATLGEDTVAHRDIKCTYQRGPRPTRRGCIHVGSLALWDVAPLVGTSEGARCLALAKDRTGCYSVQMVAHAGQWRMEAHILSTDQYFTVIRGFCASSD